MREANKKSSLQQGAYLLHCFIHGKTNSLGQLFRCYSTKHCRKAEFSSHDEQLVMQPCWTLNIPETNRVSRSTTFIRNSPETWPFPVACIQSSSKKEAYYGSLGVCWGPLYLCVVLPDSANKNTKCIVNFGFQINSSSFFFFFLVWDMHGGILT